MGLYTNVYRRLKPKDSLAIKCNERMTNRVEVNKMLLKVYRSFIEIYAAISFQTETGVHTINFGTN